MSRFRLGLAAVVMLVLLRLTIGWHFLYEGSWKLAHPSFSAEGFFRQARGPLAEYFHGLVPDYDGRDRLGLPKPPTPEPPATTEAEPTTAAGPEAAGEAEPAVEPTPDPTPPPSADDSLAEHVGTISDDWAEQRDQFVELYQFSDEQAAAAGKIYNRYDSRFTAYMTEHREEIVKYLEGLDALAVARADPAARQVPYQLQRLQDKENALRAQAQPWLDYIDSLDAGFKEELSGVVDKQQLSLHPIPQEKTTLDQIDLATAWGLTIVGICLLAGLFTRLANVAGAAFLALVVLAQPQFPGVFPAPHPSAGHALFITKECVEMMAMLALACTPVGRWAGLDFFIHHLIVRPLFGRRKTNAPDR